MIKILRKGIAASCLLLSALLVMLTVPVSAQAADSASSLSAFSIKVEEKVTGDQPETQDAFVFKLTPVSTNAPLPTNGTEITINGSGSNAFKLDLSNAPLGDVYEYTIQQSVAGNNYSADSAVYNVSIYMVKNSAGEPAPVLIISNNGTKCDSCGFTNKYTAPVVVPVTPTPSPFTGLLEDSRIALIGILAVSAGLMIVLTKKRYQNKVS